MKKINLGINELIITIFYSFIHVFHFHCFRLEFIYEEKKRV